jgi:hypothetical protein
MSDLNHSEQRNVRTALRHLRGKLGGWASVSKVMGLQPESLKKMAYERDRPVSIRVAFRAAKILNVSLEGLIGGQALATICPHCGHSRDFDDEPTVDETAPETSRLTLVP